MPKTFPSPFRLDPIIPMSTRPTPNVAGFSIVETYHRLLKDDPDLAMPIAAIESLILLLQQSNVTTVFETMDLLQAQSTYLKTHVKNPISLTAGTELFLRYIGQALEKSGRGAKSFETVRSELIANAHLIVERSKSQRDQIALHGLNFIHDGCIVLTHGGSRTVGSILAKAAEISATRGSTRFQVIYVINGARAHESAEAVAKLRAKGIPVATISEGAVAYAMGNVSLVIVGAEGVVESGGIISRMGTYQIGQLAKAMKKPFYVAAETNKFVRFFPHGQFDLPVKQNVIDFKSEADVEAEKVRKMQIAAERLKVEMAAEKAKKEGGDDEYFAPKKVHVDELGVMDERSQLELLLGEEACDAVDYTPPNLISALITENGVMTTAAVSDALIQIYLA